MSNSTDCPHNVDGYCQISSDLAQVPVPIAQDACAACIQQATPKAKNSVTCSKAIQYRTLVGMLPTPELLECIKPPTQGVGTELELLIEKTRRTLNWLCLGWLIPDKFNCGCHSTKSRMNEMGVRNPNIPVLGDAERVFVLDSDGATARKSNEGTVDECKREIVNLLEGGENAFKVRKCRYAY